MRPLLVLILLLLTARVDAIGQEPAGNEAAQPEVSAGASQFPALPSDFERDFEIIRAVPLTGRIAFSVKIGDYSRILVLDLDSQRIRKIIDGPGNNTYPSWSPDGSKLVFTSDRDGNKEIYISDWDGENQTRLTNNKAADDDPAWAPSGKRIVFYQETGAQKADGSRDANLFVLSFGSSGEGNPSLAQLTDFSGRNTTPRWSPDGLLIAFSTNRFWPGWDVCRVSVHPFEEKCLLQGAKSFCRPQWSPSGKQLVYSFGTISELDIGVLQLASGAQEVKTELPGREYDPVWSPDEKNIAFVTEAEIKEIFNIYVLQLPKKLVPLLKSPHSIRYLSWSGVRTLELEAKRIKSEEAARSAALAADALNEQNPLLTTPKKE